MARRLTTDDLESVLKNFLHFYILFSNMKKAN